jgi:hypothetical protein
MAITGDGFRYECVLYLAAGAAEAGTGVEGPTTAVPGVVCRTRGARAGRDP